mgnify:CR=1 FL=1
MILESIVYQKRFFDPKSKTDIAAYKKFLLTGGWGHGERKFKGQHPTPEAWQAFTEMLKRGKEHFQKTAKLGQTKITMVKSIITHFLN